MEDAALCKLPPMHLGAFTPEPEAGKLQTMPDGPGGHQASPLRLSAVEEMVNTFVGEKALTRWKGSCIAGKEGLGSVSCADLSPG